MDTLRRQHKAIILTVFAALAAWYYYFYYEYKIGQNPKLELFNVLGVSLPGAAYVVILVYEKFVWRILNPRFDFTGSWGFVETQFAIDPSTQEYVPAFEAWGVMTIEEGVTAISIAAGETFQGDGNAKQQLSTWHSVACDLNESGTQMIATLDHQQFPGRKGGNVKYGIEVFSVVKWREARWRKGLPLAMASEVFHCAEKGATPHKVSVHYARLPHGVESATLSSTVIRTLQPK